MADVSNQELSGQRLYFAYGSNMWLDQMRQRCQYSEYVGLAELKGWRWIITARGYANVVQESVDADTRASEVVFGLVYALKPSDEAALDICEGVDDGAYSKEMLDVELSLGKVDSLDEAGGQSEKQPTQVVSALTYVDQKRVTMDEPRNEYILRMRRAVSDAAAKGVSTEWLKKVIGSQVDLGETLEQS